MQTWNLSNVLHQQDFSIFLRQAHKPRHFRQKYENGKFLLIYFEQIVNFCALIFSNLSWIHTERVVFRLDSWKKKFKKIYPKEKKWTLALLVMLQTNSTSGYVSMYFLFWKTTKYWKVNLELGYMTLGYSSGTIATD